MVRLSPTPGEGPDGTDLSTLQSDSLEMDALGFNVHGDLGHRLADEFTIAGENDWALDTVTWYGYDTGSTTESTFTEVNYQIWDGPPDDADSEVIYGDEDDNRMLSTEWINAYRDSESTPGTDRPIMEIVAESDAELSPGTYWLDWQLESEDSAWAQPITILGETTTGNALQFTEDGAWQDVEDSGTFTPQGFPFQVAADVMAEAECDLPGDLSWLDADPTSGATDGGDSDDVALTLDAGDLDVGEYQALLCIGSNDMDSPWAEVPVTLTVEQDEGAGAESVEVEPGSADLAPEETQQFTATAHYDDDTFKEVTAEAEWVSDDTGVVTVDDVGLATAEAVGQADVTATYEDESGAASVTVSEDPVLESVEVQPGSADLAPEETQQFTATAIYDDDISEVVTEDANWSSDDTGVATVDDAGLVAGVGEGVTEVTATFEGLSDSASVTVSEDDVPPPEDPVDLVVTPSEATIGIDGVAQFEATAVYEDDTEVTVTGEADWVSEDTDVATVDDAGLVAGVGEGVTEVTATFEGLSDSSTVTVDAEVAPGPEGLERISAEPGRVEVAIAASQHRFDDGEAGAVVLARADEYPDALAGTTLAAEVDAPLLLTSSDQLLDNVADEISRVLGDDGAVYLTGGTAALDDTVEGAVDELGYQTMRLGGETRFETAGLIAEELGERSQVLVTTGLDFPDALTAGAAASANDGVVLLSAGEDAHEVVDEYLAGFDGEVTAVGGPATRAYPDAQAVMGQTRDETAVAVAEAFFDEPATFGIARRDDYPDALSGGAHIAAYEGPLLLTYTEDVPEETAQWLSDTDAAGGFVYGGTAAVSEDTFDELEGLAFGDNNNDDEG